MHIARMYSWRHLVDAVGRADRSGNVADPNAAADEPHWVNDNLVRLDLPVGLDRLVARCLTPQPIHLQASADRTGRGQGQQWLVRCNVRNLDLGGDALKGGSYPVSGSISDGRLNGRYPLTWTRP